MEISTVVRHTKFAAEETRKQILDVAEFCFCETGFSKTTLEMIAARAGCTRGPYTGISTKKRSSATSHRAGTTIII